MAPSHAKNPLEGRILGMIGGGVCDAAALQQAEFGIAAGGATDAAPGARGTAF